MQSFIANLMKSAWNGRINSVVYCDPPYAPLSATANFTAYHTNSFSLEQQALWRKRRNR
jgi:site-specific DNA-adenine methylase